MGTSRCPSCGSQSTTRVGNGLCPACLLNLALLDVGGEPGAPGPDEDLASSAMLAVLDGGPGRTVYLAERPETRQLLAIEVLHPAATASLTPGIFAARVEELRRLSHPGLGAVLGGWLTADGDYCVASEYLPGAALDRYCAARHADPATRLEFYLSACHALEHAHEAGVLHGRLGPGSIVMTRRGSLMQPVLTGFGVLPDPAVSPASDVAALGDILERLMSGASGAVADDARAAALAARTAAIASVSALVDAVRRTAESP